jgi:hypothetical protein
MTTNPLLDPLLRRLAALLLSALLAACGPGTGGTGTGPDAMVFSSGQASTTQPPAGATCAAACPAVQLRLEPALVELATACLRFSATTAWNVDASHRAVVAGTVQGTVSGSPMPATVRLQFDADPQASTQVTVTLLDAEGRALVGPVILPRDDSAAPVQPGACSGG